MAEASFVFTELEKYFRDVKKAREKSQGKEVKNFLRKEGNKLKRATLAQAKSSGINLNHKKSVDAKHILKTIQRGKVYEYNGVQAVRVYSSAPHAHLLEYGHVIWLPTGKGFAENTGRMSRKFLIFEIARDRFKTTFFADVEHFESRILQMLGRRTW